MTRPDDEDLTPITCAKCGAPFKYGAGKDAAECPICKGRAMRPSQWKRSQERALTAAGFANVIRDLLHDLEQTPGELSQLLIAEGRELLALFESWGANPPEDRSRPQAINALAAWHRRANEIVKQK